MKLVCKLILCSCTKRRLKGLIRLALVHSDKWYKAASVDSHLQLRAKQTANLVNKHYENSKIDPKNLAGLLIFLYTSLKDLDPSKL